MAKQTKSETPATPPTPAGAATAPKERGGNDTFTAVFKDGKPVEPAKKLAPQAMTVINTIRAAGKGGIKREELVKNLKGVLVTRQPEGRIVTYYQKAMVESGAITITKESGAPAASAQ